MKNSIKREQRKLVCSAERENFRLKGKKILLSMCVLVSAIAAQAQTRVIVNPAYDEQEGEVIEPMRVELSDTATIVHVNVHCNFSGWSGTNAWIEAAGKRYALKSGRRIPTYMGREVKGDTLIATINKAGEKGSLLIKGEEPGSGSVPYGSFFRGEIRRSTPQSHLHRCFQGSCGSLPGSACHQSSVSPGAAACCSFSGYRLSWLAWAGNFRPSRLQSACRSWIRSCRPPSHCPFLRSCFRVWRRCFGMPFHIAAYCRAGDIYVHTGMSCPCCVVSNCLIHFRDFSSCLSHVPFFCIKISS